MTHAEALAALNAGRWIRRPSFTRRSPLRFIARRESIPDQWLLPEWRDDEFFIVELSDYAYAERGARRPFEIGPTDFSENEVAATDWEIFELPARSDD